MIKININYTIISIDLYSNYMVYNLFIFFVEYNTHGASTVIGQQQLLEIKEKV